MCDRVLVGCGAGEGKGKEWEPRESKKVKPHTSYPCQVFPTFPFPHVFPSFPPPSHTLPTISKPGTQDSTPALSVGHLSLSLHASWECRRALSTPALPALCPSSSPACPLTSAYKLGVQEGLPSPVLHPQDEFFFLFFTMFQTSHDPPPASPCAYTGFLQ